jgi:hypothetical protein
MRRFWLRTGVAVAAAVAVATGAAGASARVHPAGHGGAAVAPAMSYSPAFGINDEGAIVGDYSIDNRPDRARASKSRGILTLDYI